MADDLTEDDWHGVQRLLFAVEDQLAKADDGVGRANGSARRHNDPGRRGSRGVRTAFRNLVQPLIKLELERRADK